MAMSCWSSEPGLGLAMSLSVRVGGSEGEGDGMRRWAVDGLAGNFGVKLLVGCDHYDRDVSQFEALSFIPLSVFG
uniref:Uncharacterized protein n=1 Tax=Oryza punctata TaxID=4537 RepID=A0A0E0K3Y8_ORYPU